MDQGETPNNSNDLKTQGSLASSPEADAHMVRSEIASAKDTLDIPAEEDVKVSRSKMYTSIFFWMPVVIAVVLTILANIALHFWGVRNYTAMIYWAIAFIAILILCLVYHFFRGKKIKEAQANTRHDAYIHHQKVKSATLGFMDYANDKLKSLSDRLRSHRKRKPMQDIDTNRPLSWLRPASVAAPAAAAATESPIEESAEDIDELREIIDNEADQLEEEKQTIEEASEDIREEKDEFGHDEEPKEKK